MKKIFVVLCVLFLVGCQPFYLEIAEKFAMENENKSYTCVNYSSALYNIYDNLGYNVTLIVGSCENEDSHQWVRLCQEECYDIDAQLGMVVYNYSEKYERIQTRNEFLNEIESYYEKEYLGCFNTSQEIVNKYNVLVINYNNLKVMYNRCVNLDIQSANDYNMLVNRYNNLVVDCR